MPTDPYIQHRGRPKRDTSVPSIFPDVRHNDKLEKFLKFDRQVLRFFCVWDDRPSMFGELREFIMHYYLVEDCIEIREVSQPNSGRQSFPIMLRKQPLTKEDGKRLFYLISRLHKVPDPRLQNRRSYQCPRSTIPHVIICILTILSRDCDDYTRRYYMQTHNFDESDIQPVAVEFEDRTIRGRAQETAPYNGYGTIEDSLGSCKHLVLKAPKKDFVKILENEHKVLRFVARMVSKHKEDKDRRFVISYRLADDMMTIYEPPQRNAGVLGGKFLERTRVLKNMPSDSLSAVSPLGLSSTPEYYGIQDLYVGAALVINRHSFVLLDADEFVLNYMESRPSEFLKSNIAVIKANNMDVLAAVDGAALGKFDHDGSGLVDRKDLIGVVKQIAGSRLCDQEIITLSRLFEEKTRMVNIAKFVQSLV
jgi:hypothetical protein